MPAPKFHTVFANISTIAHKTAIKLTLRLLEAGVPGPAPPTLSPQRRPHAGQASTNDKGTPLLHQPPGLAAHGDYPSVTNVPVNQMATVNISQKHQEHLPLGSPINNLAYKRSQRFLLSKTPGP